MEKKEYKNKDDQGQQDIPVLCRRLKIDIAVIK